MPPLKPAAHTVIQFTDFHARLLRQQDQWLAAHGISYREFLIMHHLDASPTRNMKRVELAEKLGMSASGVTRLLNPMEKIGLVTKEEGARDARVSLVRLTETGERILREAEESFNQRARAFVGSLGEEQRAALRTLAGALTTPL